MDTERNQSDSIVPFTLGKISTSPRASPRMQLERATSTGNMDLGVCSTSPRASPRMQLEGGATSTGNRDSGVCSTSPRESSQHMELEEANTTVTGLEMGECSISPRVLRHMLLDEANIGRSLELEERLLSPRVSQFVQLEEGVVAGRLELEQCSGSWSSPRDFFGDSPGETSTSGSLEGHKSPLLTSPAYENTDLWEELKAKWEMEQWKRGLRLQMVLENIEKCGRTQEMIVPRQTTAACPSSQNLNRQACDVPKPINTCTVDTINSYSSSPHDDNSSSNWFNPLDKLVKNTTTCSTNTCSTSTDTISDDNSSKWYSPLDRHWM